MTTDSLPLPLPTDSTWVQRARPSGTELPADMLVDLATVLKAASFGATEPPLPPEGLTGSKSERPDVSYGDVAFHGESYHQGSFGWPAGFHSWEPAQRAKFLMRAKARTLEALHDLDVKHGGLTSLFGVGLSGAVLVPSIADAIERPFALMRALTRDETVSSAGNLHRGYSSRIVGHVAKRVLFVDDLVGTGATVQDTIDTLAAYEVEVVGILCVSSVGTMYTEHSNPPTDCPQQTACTFSTASRTLRGLSVVVARKSLKARRKT